MASHKRNLGRLKFHKMWKFFSQNYPKLEVDKKNFLSHAKKFGGKQNTPFPCYLFLRFFTVKNANILHEFCFLALKKA